MLVIDFDLANYSFIDLNTFQLSEESNEPTYIVPSVKSVAATDLTEKERDLGVCKMCGRKLRGFDSCKHGMGPICFKKYKEMLRRSKTLF